MANYNHMNIDQMKHQQQIMSMRAQQMASDKQKLDFEGKKGSTKQLIGTILAFGGVIVLLVLLSIFGVL